MRLFLQAFLFAVAVFLSGPAWAQQQPASNTIQMRPDEAFWNAIRDADTARPFELFLSTYPDSPYVPEARKRLDALAGSADSSASSPTAAPEASIPATPAPAAPKPTVSGQVAETPQRGVPGPDISFLRKLGKDEPVYVFCRPGQQSCGLMDSAGKLVLKQSYFRLRVYAGLDDAGTQVVAETSGGEGVFDLSGRWIVTPRYTYAGPMRNGRARVSIGDETGFVDERGEMAIPLRQYYLVQEFEGEVIGACFKQRQCAVIDRDGRQLTNPIYSLFGDFVDGVAVFRKEDNFATFLDVEGNEYLPGNLDLGPFSEGLAMVRPGSMTGSNFVDRNWKTVLETPYWFADSFSEGLAAVSEDFEKYGYIDRMGKLVIPARYDYAEPFGEGFAAVCVDDLFGVIDKKGRWIVKPAFSGIQRFQSGVAIASEGVELSDCMGDGEGRYGVIDLKGKWIVPPEYEFARWVDGLVEATRDEARTYFDEAGRLVASEAEYARQHP